MLQEVTYLQLVISTQEYWPVGKIVQFLSEFFRHATRLPRYFLPTEAVPEQHNHQKERRQRS